MKEASGDGEVVVLSLGPARALDSLRKALAMGADRAVLISDDGAAGSDLVATSRTLAKALERESPDLVLFGQQSSDSDGAVLWAAVAERLRLPLISQAAELTVADGKATVKRQTEFGYDRIEASLPAVIAVSDAINEPRYPSLKGIMGAKSKPQRHVGSRRPRPVCRRRRRGRVEDRGAGARRTAPARRQQEDRRRRHRRAADLRLPRGAEAPVSTLVFLEHHDGDLQKGAARRARQGGVAGRRRGRRRDRRGRRSRARVGRRAARRREGLDRRRPRARSAAAAAARRRPRQDRRGGRLRHRALRRLCARRRRRRRPRGAARRRPELGSGRPRPRGRPSRREAPGARRLGRRRRRLEGHARDRDRPVGHLRACRDRRRARDRPGAGRARRTSRRGRRCSSRRTRSRPARRSRTPT